MITAKACTGVGNSIQNNRDLTCVQQPLYVYIMYLYNTDYYTRITLKLHFYLLLICDCLNNNQHFCGIHKTIEQV